MIDNNNFFNHDAFGGAGAVTGFRDEPWHASTFDSDVGNHLTFNEPFNALGHRRDFSLETTMNLNGCNQMGELEQRTSILSAWQSSPVKQGW
jgi:hypothetical protein